MEHQRWWAGIIGVIRGAERVIALTILSLALVAIVTILSPNSEQFKSGVLMVVGVLALIVIMAFLVATFWRPRNLADQVALSQQGQETLWLQAQLDAALAELEHLRQLQRRGAPDMLETSEDDDGD